jgi:hypothetical protein
MCVLVKSPAYFSLFRQKQQAFFGQSIGFSSLNLAKGAIRALLIER